MHNLVGLTRNDFKKNTFIIFVIKKNELSLQSRITGNHLPVVCIMVDQYYKTVCALWNTQGGGDEKHIDK